MLDAERRKMLILLILFLCGIMLEKFVISRCRETIKAQRIFQLCFSFFFAFVTYYILTRGQTDMVSVSGDARDIWQTITSFHTENIYGSYVLYKGINSVYPYVWLYDLSLIFGINEWFFIRLFYAVAFAYISSIGFPNMVERLVQKETRMYRRCFCVITMWYFWCCSMAFTQLMVDLPCLMYFILLINVALKLYREKRNASAYIRVGIWGGLCMTASGQYTMPAVCIVIFSLWVTFREKADTGKQMAVFTTHVALLFACLLLMLGFNNFFEASVVEPLREEGEWIPSNDDWLHAGLIRFRENYRSGGGSVPLPSNRNAAILEDYFGENITNIGGIKVDEYLGIFFKYPIDYILNYLNSFFLILSPDRGRFNLFPLLIFYSLLYFSLYIGVSKCKTWKSFFSPLFLIGFSFLWATVPMLVMNIEERTCMQIQGLIIALALCDDTIWDNISKGLKKLKSEGLRETIKKMNRISYPVVFYFLFICIWMTHIATLYEALGVETQEILIHMK